MDKHHFDLTPLDYFLGNVKAQDYKKYQKSTSEVKNSTIRVSNETEPELCHLSCLQYPNSKHTTHTKLPSSEVRQVLMYSNVVYQFITHEDSAPF